MHPLCIRSCLVMPERTVLDFHILVLNIQLTLARKGHQCGTAASYSEREVYGVQNKRGTPLQRLSGIEVRLGSEKQQWPLRWQNLLVGVWPWSELVLVASPRLKLTKHRAKRDADPGVQAGTKVSKWTAIMFGADGAY